MFIFKSWRSFPFNNSYATPTTLGIDRMVLAAEQHCSSQWIDWLSMGTCVTYDFIDIENNYLGGAISPGLVITLWSIA
jgi:type III pantothenate kinase